MSDRGRICRPENASSEEGAAAGPAVAGGGDAGEEVGGPRGSERTSEVLTAAVRCLEVMQAKESRSIKHFYLRRTSHPRWPQMQRLLTGAWESVFAMASSSIETGSRLGTRVRRRSSGAVRCALHPGRVS